MIKFFGLGLIGVLLTLIANLAIWGALGWVGASLGISIVKSTTDNCSVTWKAERYISADWFCEDKEIKK